MHTEFGYMVGCLVGDIACGGSVQAAPIVFVRRYFRLFDEDKLHD